MPSILDTCENEEAMQSLDIIVFGDSLPALWRGPAGGVADGTGVPEVWVKHHGHRRIKHMAESSRHFFLHVVSGVMSQNPSHIQKHFGSCLPQMHMQGQLQT